MEGSMGYMYDSDIEIIEVTRTSSTTSTQTDSSIAPCCGRHSSAYEIIRCDASTSPIKKQRVENELDNSRQECGDIINEEVTKKALPTHENLDFCLIPPHNIPIEGDHVEHIEEAHVEHVEKADGDYMEETHVDVCPVNVPNTARVAGTTNREDHFMVSDEAVNSFTEQRADSVSTDHQASEPEMFIDLSEIKQASELDSLRQEAKKNPQTSHEVKSHQKISKTESSKIKTVKPKVTLKKSEGLVEKGKTVKPKEQRPKNSKVSTQVKKRKLQEKSRLQTKRNKK